VVSVEATAVGVLAWGGMVCRQCLGWMNESLRIKRKQQGIKVELVLASRRWPWLCHLQWLWCRWDCVQEKKEEKASKKENKHRKHKKEKRRGGDDNLDADSSSRDRRRGKKRHRGKEVVDVDGSSDSSEDVAVFGAGKRARQDQGRREGEEGVCGLGSGDGVQYDEEEARKFWKDKTQEATQSLEQEFDDFLEDMFP